MTRIAIAVGALALVAGCTQGGGPSEESAPARADSAGGGGAESAKEQRPSLLPAALTARRVIHTANLTVAVTDVWAAQRKAESIAAAAGGLVENSDSDRNDESSRASLTLRVPTDRFDRALQEVSALGDVRHRMRSAKDVTDEIVDVESRIASQRKSIARVRALLDRAASIQDVVALESELARREAELESLLARQATLAKQTELATINVELTEQRGALAADDDLGFLVGLRNGWTAFTTSVAVLLTVTGALLPFAIALGLLGAVTLWLMRHLPRRS